MPAQPPKPPPPPLHYLSTDGRRIVCHAWPAWARAEFEQLAARVGSRLGNLHTTTPTLTSPLDDK